MAISYIDNLDFNSPDIKFGLFVVALVGFASIGYNLLRWTSFLASVFVLPGQSVSCSKVYTTSQITNNLISLLAMHRKERGP